MVKRCRICGDTKPRAAFYPRHDNRDGLSNACRPCSVRVRAEYRQERKKRRQTIGESLGFTRTTQPFVPLPGMAAGPWQQWDAAGRPGAFAGIAHCANCGIPAGQGVPLSRQGPDIDDYRRESWRPIAAPGYRCWHCEGRVLLPAEPVKVEK